jgi:hypothetical protein
VARRGDHVAAGLADLEEAHADHLLELDLERALDGREGLLVTWERVRHFSS